METSWIEKLEQGF